MIIDASVALKWIIEEEGSEAARALLARVDLMAPGLICSEVANGLWKKWRRGEIMWSPELPTLAAQVSHFVRIVDEASVMERALAIAIELGHAVYDCVYLALAEQLGTELVTADGNFLRKAQTKGFATLARLL